jgi:hypothetical protein
VKGSFGSNSYVATDAALGRASAGRTDLKACRRSGVVGGKVVERPATTLWLIGPKSVQKGL